MPQCLIVLQEAQEFCRGPDRVHVYQYVGQGGGAQHCEGGEGASRAHVGCWAQVYRCIVLALLYKS